MKIKVALMACGIAALLFLPITAWAEPSIEDVKLGKHWFGQEYSTEDLKGRVVLFEIWGYN